MSKEQQVIYNSLSPKEQAIWRDQIRKVNYGIKNESFKNLIITTHYGKGEN